MLNKKCQSVAEYAILLAAIIAAIAMMQTYIKRGLQGRIADASDDLVRGVNDPALWAGLNTPVVTTVCQFEPKQLIKSMTQNILEDSVIYTMNKGGTVTREVSKKTTQKAGDYQMYDYP